MTGDSIISKDKEISDEERIREMRGVIGQRASLEGEKKKGRGRYNEALVCYFC